MFLWLNAVHFRSERSFLLNIDLDEEYLITRQAYDT